MKISVITVCLNSAETIEKTVRSVAVQDCRNLEYIVVDGGSTDGTLDILKKYDFHIDKLISEPDRGIFDAMNKGIAMASGDIIAFLNSDDWYEQDALKTVEEAFAANACDCVCCDNYVVRKSGDTVYYGGTQEPVNNLFFRMIYFHSAIFCKKHFFKKEGNFDLKYRIAADYDWFLRTIKQGAKVYTIHKPVFTFSYGGISSVNEVACGSEARKIALRHLPEEMWEYRDKIEDRFREVILCAVDYAVLRTKFLKRLGNNTIILWGAGIRGRQCAGWFHKMGVKVSAIVDSSQELWGNTVEMIKIESPGILKNMPLNLIITPDKYVEDIKETVRNMGNEMIHIYELRLLCREIADNLKAEIEERGNAS